MSDSRTRALITGASSGLGVEFCRQLVGLCDEMILVARRREPLENLAKELAEKGVDTHIVIADLSTTIGVTEVVEQIRQKGPIQYLINNAGFSTLGKFIKQPPKSQHDMVSLHVNATIELCSAALPAMVAQNKGVIINVSSLSALLPMATAAVYSGTKAFLNNYSEALQQEVAKYDVTVQALCPGFVHTGFHSTEAFAKFDKNTIPAEMWMQPDEVVAESLAALSIDETVFIAGESNRQLVAART